MSFYTLCAVLIGCTYRLYLPQSKLYKSLSPLVTFSHLYSHISGLSGDQLGDQLGDKVTNFCHHNKKPPEGGYCSSAVWSGGDVGKVSALPQVIQSQCYLCALQCVESSQCYLPISINQSRLPHFIAPLTIWNARHVQPPVAYCRDCRFWFCQHWCWFWLLLLFRVCNKSVPQNIGCQAHSLPLPALVACSWCTWLRTSASRILNAASMARSGTSSSA